MKWYEIRAKAETPDTAEVMIYGDIGESWFEDTVTAASFVKDLQAISSPSLNVRINSFGGSVPDGLAIYNALKRYPGAVTVDIDGVALSIASLIAMAGSKVRIAENALFMVHAPWAVTGGNSKKLREQANLLDKFADAMASSYVGKSGMKEEDVKALLTDGEDHWYSAAEAVAAGFADEVTEPVEVAASARFDESRFKSVPAAAAAFMAKQEKSMPSKNQAAPETAVVPEVEAKAYSRSDAESGEIRQIFAAFKDRPGVAEVLVDVLAKSTVSPDEASKQLLAHLGKDVTPARPAGSHPQIETLVDETDRHRDAAVNALLARSGAVKVDPSQLQGNPYRAHKLLDMARASLDSIKVKTTGMSQMEIVAAAFTQGTSDFPVLLENVMHKSLLTAYALAPDTWSRFCAVGSVSDFRTHNRYRTGSFGNLDVVNELGEFKNKSIPDGEKSTISVATKGNIINLSRQAVINDDLGSFVGLSAQLGRAARRSVEVDVYALLNSNSGAGPTIGGTALFHSTRGNLASGGAAPTVALVDAARAAMAVQLDISGNDFLDLRPAVALCGMAQGANMRVIMGAEYDPDTANKLQRPNIVRGLVRDIVDSPRTYLTSWYLFADPSIAPVIEVAFLDGAQEPFMEMQNGFDVDGARWKVRLDYGVAAVDWRGAYRNPGA